LRGDGRALRLGLRRIGRADQREKQREAHTDAPEQLPFGILRFRLEIASIEIAGEDLAGRRLLADPSWTRRPP
jgi:hypothetical protein